MAPPRNPYAESDARLKEAVTRAVADARREWRDELLQMHTSMVRKRLATALQLPTLSKGAMDRYWLRVQVEGITLTSAR